jgi:TolA-binding protein/predicted O-methyltransferase YrrM
MDRNEGRAAKAKIRENKSSTADDQRNAAMYQSAMQFVAQGRLSDAEAICRQLLSTSPSHAIALFLLAGVRARQGDMRDAARLLRRSVDTDPNAATSWFMLGQVQQQLKRHEEAANAYRKAVKLRPDFVDALINLGVVLTEIGAKDQADECFRQVLLLLSGCVPHIVVESASQIADFYLSFRPDSDRKFKNHPEVGELLPKWISGNEVNNGGDLGRLYALILNVKQALEEDIPGHFAELGVYRGNSAAVLAHYARRSGRRLYLFDTFDGFDARDLNGVDANAPRMFTNTSLDRVRRLVGEESTSYIKGYFPESIPADLTNEQFAVVHIDCDLHEPFKAALRFFYPRLSDGGTLILHDYSSGLFAGAKQAVDEFLRSIPERLVLWPDKSGTAVIRKNRTTLIQTEAV